MSFPHKREKISQTVRRWIDDGKFLPGARFPSDQELARRFRVTHMTVRSALKPLVDQGVLERRIGFGTLVRAPRAAEADADSPAAFVASAVGVCIPANTVGFYSDVLRGIEGALFQTGRPFLLGHHWELPEREEALLRGWLRNGVRHLVLSPMSGRAAFYEALVAEGARVVFVDRRADGVDVPAATSRDQRGAFELTTLLLALGHRRIVHLAGPAVASTATLRRAGFVEALAAAGLPAGPETIVQAGFFFDDGHRATKALLAAGGPLPDAIFAVNDAAAVGALRALAEAGIEAPRDLSVAGYGDVELGRNFGLTTVRQFPERMGAEAVRLLLSPEPLGADRSFEVDPEVVLRATTPPR